MAHNQEKNQTMETNSAIKKMVELTGKDAKTNIINMLMCSKKVKET